MRVFFQGMLPLSDLHNIGGVFVVLANIVVNFGISHIRLNRSGNNITQCSGLLGVGGTPIDFEFNDRGCKRT